MVDDSSSNISLQLIGDNLNTAVFFLNEDLIVSYINAAAEELFGQSRERVINKLFSKLLQQELHKEEIEDAISFVVTNHKRHMLRGCYLQNKQERVATVDCVVSPVLKEGNFGGLIIELYRTDQQLKLAREEQLLSQQEAAQNLVRSMAHEIKNPLGGIRGAAQLLESELGDDSLKEYTAIIIAEADRLKTLVDRMLGTRQQNDNQSINIHEVLERVRHLIKADIPEGVQISFDYDPSIPNFDADLDNLIQIVLNIVVNGLKAVGDTGNLLFKTRVIRNHIINNTPHKLALYLEIRDDGSGVPDDIRDKIFFPMISGSDDGTGLGLSIAQSLAQRQNGIIEFESKPGDTRFTLSLPIEDS